jgi:DNA-binding MarR family transcriptional regulator
MATNRKTGPLPGMGLGERQQRAWLAYMRIYLRLTYEMNHQLLTDSELSLADYHVLSALRRADGHKLRIQPLAAEIGWERSRASHQIRRMATRGLVRTGVAREDRRATEVILTAKGRLAFREATAGHAELVRRLFFEGLPDERLDPLTDALEGIYCNILEHGSLPSPDPSSIMSTTPPLPR